MVNTGLAYGLNAQPLRGTNQFRQRFNAHFTHHTASVDLDVLFTGTEFGCNILIHFAGNYKLEYLSLARSEAFQALPELGNLLVNCQLKSITH